MTKKCTGCGKEYNGTGASYELRNDNNKIIDSGQGHDSCMKIHIAKLKDKLNKKKEKKK